MNDYNAAERSDVKAASKAARIAEVQRQEVITGLMSTIAGRAWMHERLLRCHIFQSSHTSDALNTAFAEGERNIGLMDLNDIMATCPDQYVLMMREYNERSSTAAQQPGSQDGDGGDQAADSAGD